MASPSTTTGESSQHRPLPNRPKTKLGPIPNGSRIQKRPLPEPSPATHPRLSTTTTSTRSSQPPLHAELAAVTDPDGYRLPLRAGHTCVIKVSSGASFMSLVKRVRKALEKAPSQARFRGASNKVGAGRGGGTLAARVGAAQAAASSAAAAARGSGSGSGLVEDALEDVVLVATGRAIQRAVEVGGFFTRERELVVGVRTRTLQAVDDVVNKDDEDDGLGEDEVRVRNVSCIEVGIRWAV